MGGATQRAKREEMLTARRASSKNDTPIFVRKEAVESKFSEASTGLLDWQIYRAAQTPGPVRYPSGKCVYTFRYTYKGITGIKMQMEKEEE